MFDEFAVGGTFPRPEDVERLRRYDEARNIYEGRHADSFNAKRITEKLRESRAASVYNSVGLDVEGAVYIVLNLPRLICQKFADLQVLQTPVLIPSEDLPETFTEDLLEQVPDLWFRWHEALSLSRGLGDSIVTVIRNDAGDLGLRVVDPGRWFPVISDNDPELVEVHQIAWTEPHMVGKDERDFLRVDAIYPDRIERRAFELDAKTIVGGSGQKIKRQASLEEHWPGLSEMDEAPLGGLFSCVHLANGRLKSGQVFGRPEFIDSGALIDDVNWGLSRWSDANDKVSHAPRIIPSAYIQQDEFGKVQVPNQYRRVFEGGRGADPNEYPRYMTYELSHETLKDQFEQSLLALLIRHEMSPALLGLQFGRQKESGEAKSLGMGTTEAATKRDLLQLQPCANQALTVCARLTSGSEASMVATHFRVGLPKSQAELLAELKEQKAMGLVTRRDMISRLYPYMTEDQLDEKLAQLDEERAAQIAEFDFTTPQQG